MAQGVIDRDKGFKEFVRRLRQADDLELVVGIVQGPIATYAAANEFGTRTIPSRPWMSSTMDSNTKKYSSEIQRQLARSVTGKITPRGAFISVGNKVRNDLIKAIIGWSSPPNAEATVKRKKSSSPLVDTGTMQRAIVYEVRPKGATSR